MKLHLIVLFVLINCLVSLFAIQHVKAKSIDPFLGVSTFAGGDAIGDGLLVKDIILQSPNHMKFLPNGEALIADGGAYVIRKVLTNGIVITIAGKNGVYGLPTNGALAWNTSIGQVSSIEFNATTGDIFLSDQGLRRIYKINKDGIINSIAGTYAPKARAILILTLLQEPMLPTLANQTAISTPSCLALHPLTGELYFAEYTANKISKIASDGTYVVVAGTGLYSYSGDGGPAVSATLRYPVHIAFNPSGELFIADTKNNRIRKIFTNGTITTIAGTGTQSFGGDGGPALAADINQPTGVIVRPDTQELIF